MSTVEERSAEKRRLDDDSQNGVCAKEAKLENGNGTTVADGAAAVAATGDAKNAKMDNNIVLKDCKESKENKQEKKVDDHSAQDGGDDVDGEEGNEESSGEEGESLIDDEEGDEDGSVGSSDSDIDANVIDEGEADDGDDDVLPGDDDEDDDDEEEDDDEAAVEGDK